LRYWISTKWNTTFSILPLIFHCTKLSILPLQSTVNVFYYNKYILQTQLQKVLGFALILFGTIDSVSVLTFEIFCLPKNFAKNFFIAATTCAFTRTLFDYLKGPKITLTNTYLLYWRRFKLGFKIPITFYMTAQKAPKSFLHNQFV
jgi:hypothetical protein